MAMRMMRKQTVIIVLLALLVLVPGLLFYLMTRSAFYGMIVRSFGANTVLIVAIALLVVLITAAMGSLIYGFVHGDADARQRKARSGR